MVEYEDIECIYCGLMKERYVQPGEPYCECAVNDDWVEQDDEPYPFWWDEKD